MGLAAGGEQAARGEDRLWAPTSPGLGIDDDPRGVTLAGLRGQPGEPGRGVLRRRRHARRAQLGRLRHRRRGAAAGVPAEGPASASAFVPVSGVSLYDDIPPSYQELLSPSRRGVGGQYGGHAARGVPGRVHGRRRPGRGHWRALAPRPQPFRTFTDPPADEAYQSLGLPLHYVLSDGDVALLPGETAGIASPSGSRSPRCGCPAVTSPCSPARPNWLTPWPRSPPASPG